MKQDSYKTTCSYCGVGCGIIMKKDSRGRLTIEGDQEHPVNKGMLCSKGLNLNHVVQDTSDRLLYPQMKWSREHPLERVSWTVAMKRAAAVFTSIIKKHGPDSVGFYVSGQCTTEEYYLVNKLVKGFIGTNNIDTNSRLCMSSAVVGYKKAFGEDSVPMSYEDIELADCFFITGANPAWCHPIIFRRLEQHKEKNPQIKIIVVDPRKTQTASIADIHLQINPGSDVYLYHAISRIIIESGEYDKKFINSFTQGFDAYKSQVLETTIDAAAAYCGISKAEIIETAQVIMSSKAFISMWAMGLNQSSIGVDKNIALINIHLLTGQVGKPGSGPFSLTGQPNAMGGREVGGMANLLAAHRNLDNANHRHEVAQFWGVEKISPNPGLTATEMFDAIESGRLKAIWIICTNPLVSMPDVNRVERALAKAKFVVVQEISNKSDTAKYADLLLPAAGWAEKEGTMTNSERRISYLPKIVDPPGEAKADAEIIWSFAAAMGYHGFQYTHIREVYDEYCRLTKGTNIDISGLNYQRLQSEGSMQWPVPHLDHMGTKRLFQDNLFYTMSKKAVFHVNDNLENQSEIRTSQYPLVLTTGRLRDQWHTMTRTGKVNKLKRHYPKSILEISPEDAASRGLSDEDLAVVLNKRGEIRIKIKITNSLKKGLVFLPMHWGKILDSTKSRANNLTSSLIDKRSKQPDFKFSTVEVKPFVKVKESICVVGAGAAAYTFIFEYRKLNTKDEILVFSKEKHPFYNRILLPEYLIGELSWEQLQKYKRAELDKLNIRVYSNAAITKINKEDRTIEDQNGIIHNYDKLVLATGSRPFLPKGVLANLPGLFTMRNREDADELGKHLSASESKSEHKHIIIVGGGLLGLEIAAALKKNKNKITIVQRGSRLMERQLDKESSQLLIEDVKERGINIYFDNEVKNVIQVEDNNQLIVSLKSGKKLYSEAIVYAVGTRPNIEIAKDAGLNVRRGVVVSDYLQTSDDNIFAIGEIAEHKSKLYGITDAAEKQARCLAGYMSGDDTSFFTGAILMNILKFDNLDLCSIGEIAIPENIPGYEEVLFKDYSQRYYKKCIIYKDRMVGAILVGDKSEFLDFKNLIEDGIELSERRTELLRGSQKKQEVLGKVICSCLHVGEGNIKDAIENDCLTLEKISNHTLAGTACGSCKPEITTILRNELNKRTRSKQEQKLPEDSIIQSKRKKRFLEKLLMKTDEF